MQAIRRLQSTIVFACSLTAASAQVPNGGFENWMDQEGYLDPVGWLTHNDIATVGGYTVEAGTPGFPGDSYAVITSRPATGGSGVIQGWVSAGVSVANAGFPNATRPAMLTGQWQFGIQPSDAGQIQVALTKWNTVTASAEPIAQGSTEVTGDLSGWQSFSVPITYLSSETPDTAYIQIVSSIDFGASVAGSFVKVDDLAFTGSVGMEERAGRKDILVYPSPASDVLNITTSGANELLLYDATGRMVLRSRITEQTSSLDVSSLARGLFTFQLFNQQGRPIASGRWVKG